jgi:carboxylesterase type B
MKKVITFVVILISVTFIYLAINMIVEIDKQKNAWKVQITNEYINIRKESNTYSTIIGQVKKGETYNVLKMTKDDNYYWYYIEIDNFKKGWVASNKTYSYLIDINNPNDLKNPIVKYYEEVYHANDINSITYEHLTIEDDSDVTITSKIVYEEENNQYWITYIVTDSYNNKTEKTQKIEFKEKPTNIEKLQK